MPRVEILKRKGQKLIFEPFSSPERNQVNEMHDLVNNFFKTNFRQFI